MRVSDLFRRLSVGVFSNLSIGMEGSGDIATAKKPAIITHLNSALEDLHSRFMLREGTVLIELDGFIRNYVLSPEYAESNPSPAPGAVLYIKDNPLRPFTGDVVKILEVRTVAGTAAALNNFEDPMSVFTPQPNVLQVPRPITGEPLGILYQANHPVIEDGDENAVINIPRFLENALISFIAYQVYTNMNTEGSSAKAAEHFSMYESRCSQVEEKDLVNNSLSLTNTRFEKRGWV